VKGFMDDEATACSTIFSLEKQPLLFLS